MRRSRIFRPELCRMVQSFQLWCLWKVGGGWKIRTSDTRRVFISRAWVESYAAECAPILLSRREGAKKLGISDEWDSPDTRGTAAGGQVRFAWRVSRAAAQRTFLTRFLV